MALAASNGSHCLVCTQTCLLTWSVACCLSRNQTSTPVPSVFMHHWITTLGFLCIYLRLLITLKRSYNHVYIIVNLYVTITSSQNIQTVSIPVGLQFHCPCPLCVLYARAVQVTNNPEDCWRQCCIWFVCRY